VHIDTIVCIDVLSHPVAIKVLTANPQQLASFTSRHGTVSAYARRPMALTRFTGLDLMLPGLQAREPAAALAELCLLLQRQGRLGDSLSFYHAVTTREHLGSTAMLPGCAIPHARVEGLDRLCFALGRSPEPITWFGRDADPVQLVFLFGLPAHETTNYLQAISALARFSQDPFLSNSLLQAEDRQEMFDILQQIPLSRSLAARR
jgi:nitrogen PTS system EIIA component